MREPRTLCELFQYSLSERPRDRAYLEKSNGVYRAIGTREFADRVQAVSAALRKAGVQPGDRVAIVSPNRIEWAIADYAILHCGAVTVPVYPTLPATVVQHILGDCDATVAFVADPSQLQKLGGRDGLPHLRHVIVFDPGPAAAPPPLGDSHLPEDSGTGIRAPDPDPVPASPPSSEARPRSSPAPRPQSSWREWETRGAALHDPEVFERVWRAIRPDDLATIIYTSGTTGVPKGVMLSHFNLVSNVLSALQRFRIGVDDTCLSFLPLSHVLERMAGHFVMWHAGACIAFAESIDTVPENLVEVQPTVLISVPRLYEKMHARVHETMASAPVFRRKLFQWALNLGIQRVRREQADRRIPPWLSVQLVLADKLVFRKLRARLGGRMRLMIAGGAPLSPAIAEFFHAAGLLILEGYGLTETSPVIAANPEGRPRIGTVGPPLDGVEVRIADNGEILARGPNVMQGYYGMPVETQAVLADGWFHTGDVGQLDERGYLRITDRLKDLIVTAGGKNVAPQPIESHLKASNFIAEAVLVGDKLKFISALVVPQFPALRAHAQAVGLGHVALDDLVRSPVILQFYEILLGKLNVQLAPYERIKRFCLLERELRLEDGEITPTMKVKRNVIARVYARQIETMYQDPAPAGVGCPPTEASDPRFDAVSSP